MILIVILIQS